MRRPRCLCSRCDLFLRAANSEYPDPDYMDGPVKSHYFEQREYQTALINLAIKRNIIACLPTGSGKTYIAYKLIEHFQHDIPSKGKKVFFLACTIPLVNQQAAFFARNLTLKVRHITGDMDVDYWTPDKWNAIMTDCQIIAMTPQIFLNIVRHAYIKLSQIALIIFDECHHAQNDHPMKHIMVEYHTTRNKYPDYDLPRILGLTATIIMGNCKASEVPMRVLELESVMHSAAVTYKDYEAVMRHATSAIIEPVKTDSLLNIWDYHSYFMDSLESNAKELQILRKERKKLRANVLSIQGIDPTLRNASNIFLCNKKPSPGDLRIAVDDVRRTYLDMGMYCAVIAINLRLAFIEFSLMDLTDNIIKMWYNKIKALFMDFKEKLIRSMQYFSEVDVVTECITPKLKKLIYLLEQNFGLSEETPNICECGDSDNKLCGLVFTDRRVTAQVLAWYLKDLAVKNKKYSFIKANFVVGTSKSAFETVESRIYAKKQTATINGFRSKKYNLLTATSVLEEGIDVPSCNIVVRFDPIKTYTSYVQSMGRARKKNAKFYAFFDSEFYLKGTSSLINFKEINEAMVSHLRTQVQKIDDEWGQNLNYIAEHSIEPFCPGGTADSPRVTMESAHEVIENYCMLLPNDGIASLQTLSWWTEENQTFKGHLKLPMNSVVNGTVQGLEMKTKELARQSVFLEAAKRLYELDELDNLLCPARASLPLKVESFFTSLTPLTSTGDEKEVLGAEENAEKEEGEFTSLHRMDWYRKKVPEIFQRCSLVIGKSYNIYRICIELSKPNADYKWQELYKLESKNTAFGIISAEEIPDVGSFPLFGGFGCMSVSLRKIPNFSIELSKEKLVTLRNFQQVIFKYVLDLGHPLLEEKELSFAIIPLKEDRDGWRIYSDLFPRKGDPGINQIFTIGRTRPPDNENRKAASRGRRFETTDGNASFTRKYNDAVVCPWYKGRPGPIYLVDRVELNMSPMSKFHDGNFSSYKNFYQTEYKKEIFNIEQPLLKCKMAGVGPGMKQLNYLLEKYAKEDEFPVYLVPELCYLVSIPASILVQLKFIPSILHRLFRILIATEISKDVGETCGWKGILDHLDITKFETLNIERLILTQNYEKIKEEERRKAREETRRRLKRVHRPIPQKKHIEDRELHYEFIHPNKITKKDIELFHEAVSGQHSAKKLILTDNVVAVTANEGLYTPSRIDLINFDDIELPLLDPPLDLNTCSGPSLLCLVEAITRNNSNEGISNERLKIIGLSFLNYMISTHTFHEFSSWTEPLMCQLRNRLLCVQSLSAIGKKKNLGEILSGSGFYPNDVWLPPGFNLLENVGEIAAKNCIHLGVYVDIMIKVKSMKKEDLEKYVDEKAPRLLEEQMNPKAGNGPGQKNHPFIKFATYTHSEIFDWALSDGLCALVGCFFTQCGSKGALKLLECFGFTMPDLDGLEHGLGSWNSLSADLDSDIATLEKAENLIPGLSKLENRICYRFNNRKFLLQALTHPSYFANDISECYQRLEFLGDAILDCLVTNHIFTITTTHNIEQLKEIRAALVNNVTYASLAVRYDLHKYLLSSSKPLLDMIDNFVIFQEAAEHQVVGHFTLISDEECWGPKHIEVPKVLGDIFEALAGAIYLDSGLSLDTVWKVFYRLLQNEIDDFCEDIPKSPLRELLDEFPGKVEFENCTSKKMRTRGREMVKIKVAHVGKYYGNGTNKTRAKEAAAKIALKMCKNDDSIIEKFDGATIPMLI